MQKTAFEALRGIAVHLPLRSDLGPGGSELPEEIDGEQDREQDRDVGHRVGETHLRIRIGVRPTSVQISSVRRAGPPSVMIFTMS